MSAPTRTPVPQQRSAGEASARTRLDQAFAALRRLGIAALPAYGVDADDARHRLAEELAARWPYGSGWYALWTEPDDRACLDQRGALVAQLPVHHHPDAGPAVAAALADVGLVVTPGGGQLLVDPG